MFSSVLLAWEYAHPSRRALELAAEFASVYDAHLTVTVLVRDDESGGPPPPELAGLPSGARQVVIPCRDPAADLVGYAHEHGYDVIVVGHHPPERSRRVFTHDTAREIVDRADVPVLIVAEDDLHPAASADGPGGTGPPGA